MIWLGRPLDKPVTAYSNSGGTGNRQSIITIASNINWNNGNTINIIDGDTTSINAAHSVTGVVAATPAGSYIQWQFGSKKYIDAVKMYFNGAPNNGNWNFQGTNTGAWTTLAAFTWNQTPQEVTFTNDDFEGFVYYRLYKSVTQNWDTSWFQEVEFKIAAGAA